MTDGGPLQAPGTAGSLDGIRIRNRRERNLSDLLDTHQAQPTEVRHQTRSRSSPLPGHETQTLQAARVTRRGGSKRLHFRASRT
ncbi:Nucleic acid-binding OB-fold [Penicillium longicatenatum]|uniref:Nucleic acid-binding OB-fold n=1 Tax=Penicillium longicatenatum TaxID=1561947 RepID=UPI002548FAB4|nr:Nucleic acid-binding OB-fold [Penicillium longicatenatum]KAJ5661177.1 Nucleic acid-binding OB-fold [Penicillium longicatenatum]